MEAQMARAKGSLAVPLKIFTTFVSVQNKNPPTTGGKANRNLTVNVEPAMRKSKRFTEALVALS
jgi:hypothetical protein